MTERHKEILTNLDRQGASWHCLLPGRNLVGKISALVNGKRLEVAITKTTFGYYAAAAYDNRVYSKWAQTPSNAVMALGQHLKQTIQ